MSPNKNGNPLIKSYILCPTIQGGKEVTRGRTNIQQPNYVIASFSATIYPIMLHTLPHPPPLCYICPPPFSPTAMPPILPHPLSKIHPTTQPFPAPTPPPPPTQFCTHLPTAPANLPQITHNPRNEPHPLLLGYCTPLITNHSTSLLILQQPR